MSSLPLVSVICLCYNHENYIREAVESVLAQTYSNIEIIIVDDLSTDASRGVIMRIVGDHPSIKYLPLDKNHGNCAAFNRGLALAHGEYIVDLATDDVMLPERIEKQVAALQKLDHSWGVVFTDVLYIDHDSQPLFQHYPYLLEKQLIKQVPQGDIYRELISTYFISAPSMLVRRKVFEQLNGYDETLAYEDFDFWIRSSRIFKYAFLNEPLTRVRKTSRSLSRKAYVPGDQQLHSTYKVCRKAQALNKSSDENDALRKRVRYEFRHAVLSGNFAEANRFLGLLTELGTLNRHDNVLKFLLKHKIGLPRLRRAYQRLRYRR
jgi:glycosyltransferase involved in cell wall biosynthesis